MYVVHSPTSHYALLRRLINMRKELKEWTLILIVFGGLYVTGLHTEVIALFQRAVLITGIIGPETGTHHGVLDGNIILEDIDGNTHTISSSSDRPTFVNVWATWCPPCIAEMPNIQALYEDMGSDVDFVMISRDRDRQKAIEWVKRNEYKFPIYFQKYRLPEVMQSQSIPTSFVISSRGEIVMKHVGMSNYDSEEFRDFLRNL